MLYNPLELFKFKFFKFWASWFFHELGGPDQRHAWYEDYMWAEDTEPCFFILGEELAYYIIKYHIALSELNLMNFSDYLSPAMVGVPIFSDATTTNHWYLSPFSTIESKVVAFLLAAYSNNLLFLFLGIGTSICFGLFILFGKIDQKRALTPLERKIVLDPNNYEVRASDSDLASLDRMWEHYWAMLEEFFEDHDFLDEALVNLDWAEELLENELLSIFSYYGALLEIQNSNPDSFQMPTWLDHPRMTEFHFLAMEYLDLDYPALERMHCNQISFIYPIVEFSPLAEYKLGAFPDDAAREITFISDRITKFIYDNGSIPLQLARKIQRLFFHSISLDKYRYSVINSQNLLPEFRYSLLSDIPDDTLMILDNLVKMQSDLFDVPDDEDDVIIFSSVVPTADWYDFLEDYPDIDFDMQQWLQWCVFIYSFFLGMWPLELFSFETLMDQLHISLQETAEFFFYFNFVSGFEPIFEVNTLTELFTLSCCVCIIFYMVLEYHFILYLWSETKMKFGFFLFYRQTRSLDFPEIFLRDYFDQCLFFFFFLNEILFSVDTITEFLDSFDVTAGGMQIKYSVLSPEELYGMAWSLQDSFQFLFSFGSDTPFDREKVTWVFDSLPDLISKWYKKNKDKDKEGTTYYFVNYDYFPLPEEFYTFTFSSQFLGSHDVWDINSAYELFDQWLAVVKLSDIVNKEELFRLWVKAHCSHSSDMGLVLNRKQKQPGETIAQVEFSSPSNSEDFSETNISEEYGNILLNIFDAPFSKKEEVFSVFDSDYDRDSFDILKQMPIDFDLTRNFSHGVRPEVLEALKTEFVDSDLVQLFKTSFASDDNIPAGNDVGESLTADDILGSAYEASRYWLGTCPANDILSDYTIEQLVDIFDLPVMHPAEIDIIKVGLLGSLDNYITNMRSYNLNNETWTLEKMESFLPVAGDVISDVFWESGWDLLFLEYDPEDLSDLIAEFGIFGPFTMVTHYWESMSRWPRAPYSFISAYDNLELEFETFIEQGLFIEDCYGSLNLQLFLVDYFFHIYRAFYFVVYTCYITLFIIIEDIDFFCTELFNLMTLTEVFPTFLRSLSVPEALANINFLPHVYTLISLPSYFCLFLVLLFFSVFRLKVTKYLYYYVVTVITISKIILDTLTHTLGKYFFAFFLLILFLQITFFNLLGLIPHGFAITSYFTVTFFWSFIFFCALLTLGIAIHGLTTLNLFIPPSTPLIILPLLFIIEIVSYFARIFSLAIRLFANITAGHILLYIFSWFISLLADILFFSLIGFVLVSILWVLEFFIGFLQAYVFTVSVTLYLNEILYLEH